jgi:glycosyltransferase involved in cell wall biosynthesis
LSSPQVSLVMPVWRPRPDWLRESVTAALAQGGSSVELVVVDDGSPDPVAELLSGFDDDRLRVERVEHAGASAARNAGMDAAEGDLVRFIDADDVITPASTATLASLNSGHDDVIAYGATMFCDERLRPLWTMTSRVQGDATEACLLGRFTTRPHAFLFPRAVIERSGRWSTEMTVSEDWDFILRALEHGSVRGTDEVVTLYRRHESGMTGDPAEGERGAELVIERYFERHPERRGTVLERRARARLLAHAGRVYGTHGRRTVGMRKLLAAARLDPIAVGTEVRQALPALAGSARGALRRLRRDPSPSSAGARSP